MQKFLTITVTPSYDDAPPTGAVLCTDPVDAYQKLGQIAEALDVDDLPPMLNQSLRFTMDVTPEEQAPPVPSLSADDVDGMMPVFVDGSIAGYVRPEFKNEADNFVQSLR